MQRVEPVVARCPATCLRPTSGRPSAYAQSRSEAGIASSTQDSRACSGPARLRKCCGWADSRAVGFVRSIHMVGGLSGPTMASGQTPDRCGAAASRRHRCDAGPAWNASGAR